MTDFIVDGIFDLRSESDVTDSSCCADLLFNSLFMETTSFFGMRIKIFFGKITFKSQKKLAAEIQDKVEKLFQ